MEVLTKHSIIKKILIVLIIIVMLNNFIMPNYVCAASVVEDLVGGFFYLLAYLGDVAIGIIQKLMIGTPDIRDGDNFSIKYSPGVIFSNTVPILDINFISPNTEQVNVESGDTETIFSEQVPMEGTIFDEEYSGEEEKEQIINRLRTQYGFDKDPTNPDRVQGSSTLIWEWEYNNNSYRLEDSHRYNPGTLPGVHRCKLIQTNYADTKVEELLNSYGYYSVDTSKISESNSMWEWRTSSGTHYKLTATPNGIYKNVKLIEYTSTSVPSATSKMQKNIASWYVALRTIALVGLLSVLLYIGIRIVLSSASAQDKAKYKNMLKDWAVALCILFVLHYMMAFMLNMIGSLNDIIKGNILSSNVDGTNSDKLMTTIRKEIGTDISDVTYDTAGYTIMYLALVMLTAIFTLQYLKRVIFMAFLTMVAPMIALTYPLDKIKDGKAQAFSYWLREYIFNCLIQPVHLLLYAILIGNAIEFATSNMLYAIVALAFLVPAEKFVKEMFGMKSQSPTATLGAAAGGAMIMSMLNKIKAKPPKEAGQSGGTGEEGRGNKVRTKTNTARTSNSENAGETNGQSRGSGGEALDNIGGNTGNNSTSSGTTGGTSGASGGYNIGRGLASAIAPNGVKGILGSIGKNGARSVGGILTGAATGTIALATKVATGDILEDPGKALTDIGVTAGVGYAAGKNFTGSTIAKARGTIEKFAKGAVGEENYNNKQFDKQFFKSSEYKQMQQDETLNSMYGGAKGIKNATQEFLNNGITDAGDIREALKNGVDADKYMEYKAAGIDKAIQMGKISQNETLGGLNGDALKRRIILANAVKSTGLQGQEFVDFAKNIGINDESEIQKLAGQVKELLLIL